MLSSIMLSNIKPSTIFDRNAEWSTLSALVGHGGGLGVMWGPRRAGKSFLLGHLAEQANGFYWQATERQSTQVLADFAAAAGARAGMPAAPALVDWSAAIRLALGGSLGPIVVLDELPYLIASEPGLASIIQAEVDARRRAGGGAALILCGSAVSIMSELIGRAAPLFGRAQMAMPLGPFPAALAARHWGLGRDPRAAFLVGAVVGGLPGYRDLVLERPTAAPQVEDWICDQVLAPWSAFLEEDALALAQPGSDSARTFRSILSAVVNGDRTPTGISRRIGLPVTSLSRPLSRMVQAGLLMHLPDPLRRKGGRYEVGDPFMAFHQSIIAPNLVALRRGGARAVWARAEPTFRSQVLGPWMERLARDYVSGQAMDVLGEPAGTVAPTMVNDPARRTSIEVDFVALAHDGRILGIGEAKTSGAALTSETLAKLRRVRELLAVPEARLIAVTEERPRPSARTRDVRVIGLREIYAVRTG